MIEGNILIEIQKVYLEAKIRLLSEPIAVTTGLRIFVSLKTAFSSMITMLISF